MKNIRLIPRIIFISFIIAFMLFSIGLMYASGSGLVVNGKVDLTSVLLKQNQSTLLNGNWEFYWDKLLVPEDFISKQPPQMDSLLKVPGTWDEQKVGVKAYPSRGVATYRMVLKYPSSIKDPAIRIQNIATAHKLYANGRLMSEVGKVSNTSSDFIEGEKSLILDLPNDTQEIELIFQVANLHYARGGIRESPVFGSKQVIEQQKMLLLSFQLFFIGSVFIFAIYYLILFILQRENFTYILFSILCFITAVRSLIWGEAPISIFFPDLPLDARAFINYSTGYNIIPVIILLICTIYKLEYKKITLGIVLLPTVFFNLLLLTPPQFMSIFTNYLYIVILIQIIYIIGMLIRAVHRKKEHGKLMFLATNVFILTIILDILHYKGMGGSINTSFLFLYGNFVFIIVMSYVQAMKQDNINKKLILYNENLIESDKLKDKIMATEMSFLQAQIKPHFLYNALDAIANVCEKDGKNAGKLIVDLAIYLRGSLEFNNLDKMVTIEKELEFIDKYFNIEQARFGEKIQLIKIIELPFEYQIPVLILQPLVENAVRHGISKKIGGGTVYIRMKQTDNGASIEVEDNGVGIGVEKLALLLSEERLDGGVGLLNIHHRLLKMYGKGLEISSEREVGTCISIEIHERRNE